VCCNVTKMDIRAHAQRSVCPEKNERIKEGFIKIKIQSCQPIQSIFQEGGGPNVPPLGSGRKGIPFASAVFCQTVLPHHFRLIPPLGNWRQKNIKTSAIATPESIAAERI